MVASQIRQKEACHKEACLGCRGLQYNFQWGGIWGEGRGESLDQCLPRPCQENRPSGALQGLNGMEDRDADSAGSGVGVGAPVDPLSVAAPLRKGTARETRLWTHRT